jgi:hypothetical protein
LVFLTTGEQRGELVNGLVLEADDPVQGRSGGLHGPDTGHFCRCCEVRPLEWEGRGGEGPQI